MRDCSMKSEIVAVVNVNEDVNITSVKMNYLFSN
jgi:hypothetical protein